MDLCNLCMRLVGQNRGEKNKDERITTKAYRPAQSFYASISVSCPNQCLFGPAMIPQTSSNIQCGYNVVR